MCSANCEATSHHSLPIQKQMLPSRWPTFRTNNPFLLCDPQCSKRQTSFLLDQRLLVTKEFSRGIDGSNYCWEDNILVTEYKEQDNDHKGLGPASHICLSQQLSGPRLTAAISHSAPQLPAKQQCYFCQVWSDCLCLLRSCLLQSPSKSSLWPCLQGDSSGNRSA